MSDVTNEHPWKPAVAKVKELHIAEILQKRRADGSSSQERVDLRDVLVQRTMARHDCDKEQALTLILAFGG